MLENLTKLGKFEEVYIPGRLHKALVENYHEDFIIINFTMSLSETKASQPLNSKLSQHGCWFSTLNSPNFFSKMQNPELHP